MIVRLTGVLAEIAESAVTIERDGLAREVLIPQYAVAELASRRGQSITLHTLEFLEGNQASGNLVPRMLGFPSPGDREFFQRFLNVKGIGPRKALKALAEPTARVAGWIKSGETRALARLPGIGQRGAELIVASLKGKLDDLVLLPGDGGDGDAIELTDSQKDALAVLVAWGDPRGEAERWLTRAAGVNGKLETADEWVRAAYRIKTGAV